MTAGDRLVVEVGYRALNTSTTPYSGTLYYGGTGGDLTDGGAANTLTGYLDITVLRRWSGTLNPVDYIYDTQAELSWDDEPTATATKVYIGSVGFDPLDASGNDASGNTYVATGLTAETMYEAYVGQTIAGTEYFSRSRRFSTVEANALAVCQDNDDYIGQAKLYVL